MACFLLAGKDEQIFTRMKIEAKELDKQVRQVETGQEALSVLDEDRVDLLVVDEALSDMTGKELIEQVVFKNPLTNCAVVSSLSEKEFHDKYEGLGVLSRLSRHNRTTDEQSQTAQEVSALFTQIEKINRLQADLVNSSGDLNQ